MDLLDRNLKVSIYPDLSIHFPDTKCTNKYIETQAYMLK